MTLIDNSVYIVPSSIKKDLLIDLSKEKELKNIKFVSLKEFIDNVSFTYDERAIVFLMKEYNYKYENALEILNNIRYIDKEYDNKKLINLNKIKNDIKDLLIYNDNYKDYIKNKNIFVYGYDYIDKYDLNILNSFNVTILNKEINDYKHTIYKFNNILDEVIYVSNKIRELLDKNIDINKIKLVSLPSEYNYLVKLIFGIQNINIYINDESIYSSLIVNRFINLFDLDKDITLLEKEFDLSNEDNLYIYNNIITLLNKYSFIEDKSIKREILINELKGIKTNIKHNKNEIEVKGLSSIKDDEYTFLLGFNEGNILSTFKDEDYLNDKEKELLGLDTSSERNIKEKESVLKSIKSIKNLVITYKLNTSFNEYIISSLNEELGYEIEEVSKEYIYSNKLNKILLSMDLDNLVKYSINSEELELLYNNYKDINYMSFDNKYKSIDKNKLYSYLKNELTLSYTSVNNYYKCKFRYYLDNILKLDREEDKFNAFIGSLFHFVLSKCFDSDFDFDKEYNDYLNNRDLTPKELFFVNKLKKDLLFIIDTIKKQNSYSNFKDAYYEKKYLINKDSSIKVNFIGFIDKLMYKEYKGKTLLAIIDYKTGNQEINLNKSVYGLNLQLPIYLYLSRNSDIENIEVVGFYIQKILNEEVKKDSKKSYEVQKEEELKLQGYSLSDEELINEFDNTYENSKVIKSLGKCSTGFRSYSKLLTKREMDSLYNLVDKMIDEARDNILDARFDINPKVIGFDNVSCDFCKYKDICFMKKGDINYLNEVKDLSFLGGDSDANVD